MKTSNFSIKNISKIISSNKFFIGIIILLIIQSLWIAASSNYPMAFDEDFHVGLIKLYSEHLLPFWSAHPVAGDPYGALTRDPSYLYHYILGILYIPLNFLINSFEAQIMFFRIINIGLLATSLIIFKKLLSLTGASSAIINLTLLIFVLVPVVPLLGAQINYDNLIIPLTAYALLLTVQLIQSFNKKSFEMAILLKLLAVCLFASLVKYAFLPIFLSIAIFVPVYAFRNYGSLSKIYKAFIASWIACSKYAKILLMIAIIIFGGLAIERYGVNMAQYHKPVPDCGQVLSYDNCKSYGPWIRDYNFALNKVPNTDTSAFAYTTRWTYGMWLRSFFSVSGKISDFKVGNMVLNYQSRGPLLLPAIGSAIFIISGFAVLLLKYRDIYKKYQPPVIVLFTISIGLTAIILWMTQYQFFIKTTQPVAINGRYLFPVLPLIFFLFLLGFNELIRSIRLKTMLASLLIICFIWGGGALTYVLRSETYWYWPNSSLEPVNMFLQRNLGPLVPGYNNDQIFLRKV